MKCEMLLMKTVQDLNKGDQNYRTISQVNFILLFFVVIRVFSSPPQRPMTSNFEGFPIPDFIHYIFFPILILQKEPVFPFEC